MLFIGLLAHAVLGNFWLALAASILYGVVPWLFLASRYAADLNTYPAALIVAIYLWVIAVKKGSVWLAGLSGVAWVIAFYSYTPAKLMIPLYLSVLLLCYSSTLKNRGQMAVTCVLVFLCGLIPAAVYSWHHPVLFWSRLSEISAQPSELPFVFTLKDFLARYVDYFSVGFLCGPGSPWFETAYGGMPVLLVACLLPLIAGGYFLFRNFRRDPFWLFLMIAVLTYPLAASLTSEERVWTRTNQAAPLFILIVTVGVKVLWQRSSRWKMAVIALALLGVAESALFFHYYFGAYKALTRLESRAGIYEALVWQPESGPRPKNVYLSQSLLVNKWDVDPIDSYLSAIWGVSLPEIGRYELQGRIPHYKLYNRSIATEPGSLVILKSPVDTYNHVTRKIDQNPNLEDPPPESVLIKTISLPTLPTERPSAIKIYRKHSATTETGQ
jgi:hypothetical protein